MNKENHTEETATTINSFYSETNIFNDPVTLNHQSRIAKTIDPILEIDQIDVADGLKDSLMEYGFNLETLLNTTHERTAEILGIDLYVAKLIHDAAKKQCWLRTPESNRLLFINMKDKYR